MEECNAIRSAAPKEMLERSFGLSNGEETESLDVSPQYEVRRRRTKANPSVQRGQPRSSRILMTLGAAIDSPSTVQTTVTDEF